MHATYIFTVLSCLLAHHCWRVNIIAEVLTQLPESYVQFNKHHVY